MILGTFPTVLKTKISCLWWRRDAKIEQIFTHALNYSRGETTGKTPCIVYNTYMCFFIFTFFFVNFNKIKNISYLKLEI
jgi:hypothetical protein